MNSLRRLTALPAFAILPLLLAPALHAGATIDVSAAEHVHPALPVIPHHTFNLADFGAVGDGRTMNTAAFTAAISTVARAGGGQLVVPKGVYRTQPFVLCSSLDLHLDAGAVIQAPATFEDAGLPDPSTLHSQAEVKAKVKTPAPLITGDNLHDLALTGAGTIDGEGAHWWAWSERAGRAEPGRLVYTRPNMVVISGCERLLVADLTFSNSSRYHLVTRNVTDLTVERVKVRAPFNAPNTDAIDYGPGTNFWIHDCDIDTGDDDICAKSGGTNILIENNTIRHGHGISIGSGTTLGIHNMLVRHCTFDGADYAIRIKSMRGAGGDVSNVRYTDITMKNVGNAIMLYSDYVDGNRPDFKGDATKVPSFHDVLIDHVTVESARNAGRIVGLPESRITNIELRDVHITAEKALEIKDADEPTRENVTVTIKPDLLPPRIRE